MRIATYNVHGFTGYPAERATGALGSADDPRRLTHYASVLRELDCDLIAIQEGASERFAGDLAARLRLQIASFASPVRWPGHLLSRFGIRQARTLSSSGPDAEKRPFSRSAGSATIEIAQNRTLRVLAVHLHPRDRQLRTRETAVLKAELDASELQVRASTIVLGDFNCAPRETIHAMLEGLGFVNALERMHGSVLPTRAPAVGRQRAVDHIYVGTALAGSLVAADVVVANRFRVGTDTDERAWANSDHQPVVAELELP
jgi:endonuclease/exonuclease/phosphatase family metal-dependent hydrolase